MLTNACSAVYNDFPSLDKQQTRCWRGCHKPPIREITALKGQFVTCKTVGTADMIILIFIYKYLLGSKVQSKKRGDSIDVSDDLLQSSGWQIKYL